MIQIYFTSAEKVMNFFQKFKKASGATINFEKSKILAINTDQITHSQERLPHKTIKELYETIKILEITLADNSKKDAKSHKHTIIKKFITHGYSHNPEHFNISHNCLFKQHSPHATRTFNTNT